MGTTTISPFALKPNPWNSNRVDRENFEKLKKSLQTLGSFKPILVRQIEDGYEILGGYHRVEAAKELGFPTVPIWNLGVVDDARAKEISLVDNTRYGEDDAEALSKLLDSLETDLLTQILPESPVELPDTEDLVEKLDAELRKEKEVEDTYRVLKFRLENDKADEVEAVLSKIAFDKSLRYPDGYSNFSEALYHALILDK
jgi:ParB-like chromosome segregation protein Spo0J